jgi:Domain of unknown function (DUF1858)
VAAPVSASENIRALLARAPGLAAVFERHGLLGCGGPGGPDEPIGYFARIHRVDPAELVAELNRALEEGAGPAAAPAPAGPGLYRRFVVAALATTLTLGATFGAVNLLGAQLALLPVPPVHKAVHGAAQVFGFVWLFVMGVAYHALPRFWGTTLRAAPVARATFWLALGGLVLRVYGELEPWVPGALPAFVVGTAALAASPLLFSLVLATTFRAGRPAPEPFHAFLAAGTGHWIVAGALAVRGALLAAAAGEVRASIAGNEAIYLAALLGGTSAWIEGMVLRTGPVFLGLPAPRRGWLWAALAVGQAGAVAAWAGAAVQGPLGTRLADGGLVAAAAGCALFVVAVRPLSRAPLEGESDRALARALTMAFAFALLFALLATAYAAIDLATGAAHTLVLDAARHAYTLGFVTVAILAMAARILPVFGGVALRWPRLHAVGLVLVGGGVVLRQAEVVAAWGGWGWLLVVSAVSGIVGAAGVALAGASVLRTVLARPVDAARTRGAERAPIAGGTVVADLIADHEEALPILLAAGFTPLANALARRTLARAVDLATACRLKGIALEPLLDRIRGACPHRPSPPDLVPVSRLVRAHH